MSAPAPVHPQVAPIVEMVAKSNGPQYWQGTPEQARAQHAERAHLLDAPPEPVLAVHDAWATGGEVDVPLRVYVPRAAPAPLPVIAWYHGGGHVVGTLDSYDSVCRRLALGADAVVVSVDYRLGPEHKFPAAVEDAWAALRWVAAQAASLGADASRIAVAGDSAGGNLAAVVALMARDARAPRLCAQVLIYPATAARPEFESSQRYADGYILTRKLIDWFQNHYVPNDAARDDWRFAPLLATSHASLPPALVLLAECDPLHDEGVAYAQAMRGAGTDTRLSVYKGMVHPFFSFSGLVDAARDAMKETCEFLVQRF